MGAEKKIRWSDEQGTAASRCWDCKAIAYFSKKQKKNKKQD